LVRGTSLNRRAVLAEVLRRPEVRDGVIQGRAVRLVLQEKVGPPDARALGIGSAEVTPTPPRFEDAFVDLLGGARRPGGRSQGSRVRGQESGVSGQRSGVGQGSLPSSLTPDSWSLTPDVEVVV